MVTSWKLYDAIRGMASGSDRASTTTAVYVGRDSDGRDIVRLKGSGIATPVNGSMSASAKEGDTLSVDVSNGRLSVVGNLSDPGVGGEYVSEAVGASESAVREDMGQISTVAESAAQTARGAASIANTTAQHFWVDGQGVHVTQVTQDAFLEEPSGPNQLSNANGILLRDGKTYLASFATDGMDIYDGTGNGTDDIVAQFTSDGMRVGYENGSNVSVDDSGMNVSNYSGVSVGSIQSSSVTARVEKNKTKTTSTVPMSSFAYLTYDGAPEYYQNRYARLTIVVRKGGSDTTYSTDVAAYGTNINLGNQLYVRMEAVGNDRFRVGLSNASSSSMTNARVTARWYETILAPAYRFGDGVSSGAFSFVEGRGTEASAEAAHAEGEDSVASANYTHAQNRGTIAAYAYQTALGRFNRQTTNQALIIGNGTSDSNRSNALTVDWQGNVVCGTVNGIDIVSAITGVAQFQGELDSQATLEAADYEAGWFWVVTAAGTYAGNACEQGDMVYAVADRGEAYAASDFVVAQANLGPTTNLSNIDIDQICV